MPGMLHSRGYVPLQTLGPFESVNGEYNLHRDLPGQHAAREKGH